MNEALQTVYDETGNALRELLTAHPLDPGSIVVVGCSSSEIAGGVIGHDSSEEIGKTVFAAVNDVCKGRGLFLAAQCCEHLNRALVIEKTCAEWYGYEAACVVPWLHGGGSFATAAYHGFEQPVVVEHVKAVAGLDIGSVLIGMHLKEVAVPVHLTHNHIGSAYVVAAYSRPRLIGGERARYE